MVRAHTTQSLTQLELGISLRESDPEQAKDLLSQAERYLEGEERQECLIHLAIAYHWTGEYSEGLALVDDLLGDHVLDKIRCQALLAKATLQMSSPKQALLTLANAQACCQDAGPSYHARWHNQRARALQDLKQYDQASIEFAGAASIFEESGDAGGAAMALNNLAGVYLKWGKLDEALVAVERSVSSFKTLDDPRLPHAQDQMAQILVALGRAEEARALIDRVIPTVNGDRKELLLECLLTRAAALIQLGTSAGFSDVDRAGEIADYLGRPDLRLNVVKARKELSAVYAKRAHVDLVKLALEQTGGQLRQAALKLGVSHKNLITFIQVHNLERKPRREAAKKSLIRRK